MRVPRDYAGLARVSIKTVWLHAPITM